MDVYLTEEELEREQNLLAPHEISYEPLEGRTEDIRSLKEQVSVSDDMPKPPSSC